MKITFNDLEKAGYASVTDYCRYLVKHYRVDSEYSLDDSIEVYRGEMLCLTVTSIKEAAEIEPTSSGWKKYTPQRQSKGRGAV